MKRLATAGVCLLYLLSGRFAAKADESGAYYDWKVTRQPERPYLHRYDQTLVMKIIMADKLPGEKTHVLVRCDQALDVIRRVDNVTAGVPKIVYLSGWQYNGHDSKYPAWGEVNPGIKRPQDATALDSLKWLMTEATNYHTTVSLHINMFGAYRDSPLWDEYLRNSVIAKDTNGVPIKAAIWPKGSTDEISSQSYNISYAREWELGLAQRRIDGLLAMLPIQRAGTIHIDAFHTIPPTRRSATSISPFLGYPLEQEAEAQRKILRYFRDRGVDVTAEFATQLRIDPFIGLQPMAYHFRGPGADVPPSLYCGTAMDRLESVIRGDPVKLPGLTAMFCTQFLPWYYAHNTNAAKGSQPVIGSPREETIGGEKIQTGDDVCLPALWRDHALVAYSRAGHRARTWDLPPGWETVEKVRISELTVDGPKPIAETGITNQTLTLSLQPNQGVLIVPSGKE